MVRHMEGILLLVLFSSLAFGQQRTTINPQLTIASQMTSEPLAEQEVLRLIAQRESEVRIGKKKNETPLRMAKLYSELGSLYAGSWMNLKAEDSMRRAIAEFKNGPQQDLAQELRHLGVLHLAMGKVGMAERDLMKALKVYQSLADPVGIATTQTQLANLFSDQKNFKKGEFYSRRAFDVLESRPEMKLQDRIAARWALGFALTGRKSCGTGIMVLRDTFGLASNQLPEYGHYLAYSQYVLGFGYWHCGDRIQASEWLRRGTSAMKDDFGWSRKIYVNAMSHYARFLRETGDSQAADTAEAIVMQSEAVVNVRELSGRTEAFRFHKKK